MRTDVSGGNDNFGWKHGNLGSENRTYVDGKAVRIEGRSVVWHAEQITVSMDDPRYCGRDIDGDVYIKNHAIHLDNRNSEDTLIVVVNRNPISWLQSMHKTPHHALELYGLSFSEFIRRPWRYYDSAPINTLSTHEDRQYWIRKGILVEDEASIFEHRNSSLEMFASFVKSVQNVVFVPYEAALFDPKRVITEIARQYGIALRPAFEAVNAYKRPGNQEFSGSQYDPISRADLLYIVQRLPRAAEAEAGYSFATTSDAYSAQQLANPSSIVNINPMTRYFKSGETFTPTARPPSPDLDQNGA